MFSVKNVERTNAFFERFGGLTIILARFVPIVRTFAPVAAGVGHMHKGKYTLYNLIGALLWGFGLTMFGYLIGFIPWVAEIVTEYIDIILLVAVGGTAVVTLWHYLRERSKAKKAAAAGEDVVTDHAEAEALVLDSEVFERGPEHHHRRRRRRHAPRARRPWRASSSPPASAAVFGFAGFFAAGFFAAGLAAGILLRLALSLAGGT